MKWQVGDVTVTKIVELEMTGGTRFRLPQATREEVLTIPWLVPHFADAEGRLTLSIHALIIETPSQRIVVDTCLGNDKQGRRIPHWNDRQGRFLEDMTDAGFAPETIDTVLCTHLHVDHVGWNTRLVDGEWVATFPNARYLFGRVEYEHWSRQTAREDMIQVLDDSIRPIFEGGLADLVPLASMCGDLPFQRQRVGKGGRFFLRVFFARVENAFDQFSFPIALPGVEGLGGQAIGGVGPEDAVGELAVYAPEERMRFFFIALVS